MGSWVKKKRRLREMHPGGSETWLRALGQIVKCLLELNTGGGPSL